MKIFKLLHVYIKKHFKIFSLFILLNIIISLLTISVPLLSGTFIDMLLTSSKDTYVLKFIKNFVLINIIIIFGTYLNQLIHTKLQSYYSFNLNRDVINHLHNVEYSFFSDKDPIYLTQRINTDCNSIATFEITFLQNMFTNIMSLLLSLFFIWRLNYTLVVIVIIFNFFNLLIIIKFKNQIYLAGYTVKEYTNKYFSFLNMLLIRIKFIKINEYSEIAITKLKNFFDEVFSKILRRQIVLNNYFGLCKLNNVLQSATLFFLGGNLVIKGILSIGNLTICFSYMSTINNAINYFLNLGQEFQNIKSSVERINELLNIQVEHNGKIKVYNVKNILVRNLTFRFNENILYTNLNIDFKQNYIYGIEGHNGSGKTTLIDILTGLYQQKYQGVIRYNGFLQDKLDMKFVRRQCVSYCCQQNDFLDSELYERLIKKNMTLLQSLNLEISNGFLDSLKKGNLSGGEKQKLNILYCLSKFKASLLFFDEPSSYLDQGTVEKVMLQIEKMKKGRIIIIVSHDKRVLKHCDKLINID
ncbi:ATP-binding cassette domain-containing protein [Holdemanella biformis]|uniref:ATP-binding cassette domain-containing protein n=1 Tax=Holdemanella biformis TaxID=1735 RepID=UPI0026721B0D|nr:ABC transporter ATP-binding protein [Holdemanella biformis]